MKTSSKILIFKIILMPYSFRTHVIMVLPNTPFFFVNMNCHNFWEDNAVFFQFPFSRYWCSELSLSYPGTYKSSDESLPC